MSYTVTLRVRGKTTKERYDSLESALIAIEADGREQSRLADAQPEGGGLMRKIEPVQQVVARLELSGPGRLRAGIDVRGDGSAEAYTGRFVRRLIAPGDREDAWSALRRAIAR